MKLINVKFTEFQKDKLRRAYNKRENISLKLVYNPNGDRIYVNERQCNKLMKGKPAIINFNDSHFRAMKQDGGSLLSSLLGPITKIARKVAPALTKTVLPGLATGVSSALASLGVDSLFGKGIDEKTGDIIKALAIVENELRKLPKEQRTKFNKIMMTGNGDTKTGGFLSGLLATLGIPLIIKELGGSGLHNRPYDVKSYKTHPKKIPLPSQNQQHIVKQPEGTGLNEWELFNPPPFNDNHEIIENKGKGIKKKIKRTRHFVWPKQRLSRRPVAQYPLLKFVDEPISNIDLMKWIEKMHINNFGGVYAKDELNTDMIKPNHFYIINLDNYNSPRNGTHWVTFYYHNQFIEYFDSYGLLPFEFITKNYPYIYNSSQFQQQTVSCGYYCLYYIYHRYNGLSFMK